MIEYVVLEYLGRIFNDLRRCSLMSKAEFLMISGGALLCQRQNF